MRVLLSEEAIAVRVRELGAEITADYAESDDLVLIAVMRGSMCFVADLMRAINRPLRLDYLALRSYDGIDGADVAITTALTEPLRGADVLIIEDIVDRGVTLRVAFDLVQRQEPRSIEVCTLLQKPLQPGVAEPRYAGFVVGKEFVVGYGLDYDQRYRNLPYIAVPNEADIRR